MSDRRAWTWRHAILKSDLKATTRHVLLTIGCHMNDVGEGCFPTTAQLAAETGLSERAVCEHINLAITEGWLERKQHGFRGQRWKRNEYRPAWPESDASGAEGTDAGSAPKALTEDQCLEKGTDAGSVEGTDPHDMKALTDGQWDKTSQGSSQSLSHTAAGGDLADGERVCVIFNLDLDDWHLRVAEHFVAPLERCLELRKRHRQAMGDLIRELAGHSSKALALAAATIRRERSVFPTIAQAHAACMAANKITSRPMRLPKGTNGHAIWRRHLEATGNQTGLRLHDSLSETTVDGELFSDVVRIFGGGAQ